MKNIDKIYKKYDQFYQKPDKNYEKDYIKILKYGKSLYEKSEHYIDITSHELLENIKEDKTYSFNTSINEIDFNNKNSLVNINIENIIGAYATNKVKEYLEKNNIINYVIKEITKDYINIFLIGIINKL